MAWTESTEGRNVNNTETVALVDASTASYTDWLEVPKGKELVVTIDSAFVGDGTVAIDVEGSKSSTPATSSSTSGGLNFGSLTHTAEECMSDIVKIPQDDADTDVPGGPVSVTLPAMGYSFIRFKQLATAASTANVVYDVWYNGPVQNTLTITKADPS
tara:strand:+ start:75 stop:548 length:474 start_codon:yes stop_codon:yes gene_type:complete